MIRRRGAVALLWLVGVAASAPAAGRTDACALADGTDGDDAACARAAVTALLEEPACLDAAVAAAAAATARYPDDPSFARQRGIAYVLSGNLFWGIRSLSAALRDAPDPSPGLAPDPADCPARAFLALAYLRVHAPAAALAALGPGVCTSAADETRHRLLFALAAHATGDAARARAHFAAAEMSPVAFPADRPVFAALSAVMAPERLWPYAVRVSGGAGYASNAAAAAPPDATAATPQTSSALLSADLWARVTPLTGSVVRPTFELDVRTVRFFGAAQAWSTLALSGRAGVVLEWPLARLGLHYRPEYVLLDGGGATGPRGPHWYFGAHRGEVEVELAPAGGPRWTFWAGAGRRDSYERGRARTEVDVGVGCVAPFAAGWRVSGLLAARVHDARNPAFNLVGGTALVALDASLPWDMVGRVGLAAGVDTFPDSAGTFHTVARRDLVLRPGVQVQGPSWGGVRVGLHYEFTWRDSTAPGWGFADHRVWASVSFHRSFPPPAPPPAPGPHGPALPWGIAAPASDVDLRLPDLLQREDPTQRGCGCGG